MSDRDRPVSLPFPRWLLRWDPALASAATNPVYLAFLEHRSRQGLRWRSDFGGTAIALIPLLGVVLFIAAVSIYGAGWSCTLLPLPIVGWYVSARLQARLTESPWLPKTFNDVLFPRVSANVLQDLWLTPLHSRDFVRALALERRGSTHTAAIACCLLPALAILVGIWVYGHQTPSYRQAVVGFWFLVLSVLIFAMVCARAVYWYLAATTITETADRIRMLSARNRVSAGSSQLLSYLFEALVVLMVIAIIAVFLGLLTTGMVVYVIRPILAWIPDSGSALAVRFGNAAEDNAIAISFGLTLLLGAVPIWFLGTFLQDYAGTVWQRLEKVSAPVFARFCQSVFDPEADSAADAPMARASSAPPAPVRNRI